MGGASFGQVLLAVVERRRSIAEHRHVLEICAASSLELAARGRQELGVVESLGGVGGRLPLAERTSWAEGSLGFCRRRVAARHLQRGRPASSLALSGCGRKVSNSMK